MKPTTWVLLPLLGLSSCRFVLGIDGATEIPAETGGLGGDDVSGPDGSGVGGTGGSLTIGDGDGDGDGSGGVMGDGDDNSMGGDDGGPTPKTPCEKYCEDMDQYCTDDDSQYVGVDQCLKTCELYEEGEVGENGNTQSCRVKYASKGRYTAGVERSFSCRQAGPGGYDVCGSMCEGYCTVVMQACTPEVTSLYYFETFEDCMTECDTIPVPSEVLYSVQNGDVFDGGHLQCRLFHAQSALMMDAGEHCEHALGVTLCEISE